MIVDSSALVAILQDEPERASFIDRIESSDCRISAANMLETAIVIDKRRSAEGSGELDEFVRKAQIEIVPFDAEQAKIAREAYRDFGKSSGHPARLNFGDCFAYALAKAAGETLLYKGTDFSHTDVASALD